MTNRPPPRCVPRRLTPARLLGAATILPAIMFLGSCHRATNIFDRPADLVAFHCKGVLTSQFPGEDQTKVDLEEHIVADTTNHRVFKISPMMTMPIDVCGTDHCDVVISREVITVNTGGTSTQQMGSLGRVQSTTAMRLNLNRVTGRLTTGTSDTARLSDQKQGRSAQQVEAQCEQEPPQQANLTPKAG